MGARWNSIEQSPLYDEHLPLGAVFGDPEALCAAPLHYGSQAEELVALEQGCALCDLSGMTCLLVRGEGVGPFVQASCACALPQVGECAFGAVVTGDGSVASIPLVARTGDTECLVFDPTERGLMLEPWLGFLAQIEQDGFRPFEGVTVGDETDSLVPLLLWGPKAPAILADYVPSAEALPVAGHIDNVRLDSIECLVAALPRTDEPSYLVLVPPAAARVLWRSFLSFSSVVPVGTDALVAQATRELPWLSRAIEAGKLELVLEDLLAWELARKEGGYVGERALHSH